MPVLTVTVVDEIVVCIMHKRHGARRGTMTYGGVRASAPARVI
jgi:hypothetical protein